MRSECKETPVGAHHWSARALATLLLALVHVPAPAGDLSGRIWVPGEARFTTPAEVEAAVGGAEFVLLGETHTVALHHALQSRLVRAAAADRKPAIVFEMIPRERQADIERWHDGNAPDAPGFGPAVGWAERGWPPWKEYAPIVEAALDRGLPLHAGAPPTRLRDTVAREGLAALDDATPALPGLSEPLPASGHARLLDTLRRVHCGLPDHAPVERMIAVQRLRDAAMAEAMRAADREHGDGALLITGHGHARRDYGVPVYLERAAPDRSVLSIAFFGTIGAETVRAQREAAGGTLPFDYVWFTDGGEPAPDCADGAEDG